MTRFALLLSVGYLFAPAAVTCQATLVVVVPLDSPAEDISLNELKRLFEGRLTSLGGMRGIALYQHRGSREQFFAQVMNSTVSRVARAWIALVFAGDAAVPPLDYDRAAEVMRAVSERRSSVGFIPLSELDSLMVKALLVDGHTATDPGYPLG